MIASSLAIRKLAAMNKLPADAIERANLGFDLDELPSFIGVKGGAARQVLESLVHSDR